MVQTSNHHLAINLSALEQKSFDKQISTLGENANKVLASQLTPIVPERIIKIAAKTWHRESHGLFDYEANQYIKKQLHIRGSGFVMRQRNDELQVIQPSFYEPTSTDSAIMSLIYSQGQYFVYHASELNLRLQATQTSKEDMSQLLKDLARKVYVVLKFKHLPKSTISRLSIQPESFEAKGTVIKVGDVIKFGRVPFRVKESSLEKNHRHEDSLQMNESMEKNLTDIESLDIEREIEHVLQHENEELQIALKNSCSPRHPIEVPTTRNHLNHLHILEDEPQVHDSLEIQHMISHQNQALVIESPQARHLEDFPYEDLNRGFGNDPTMVASHRISAAPDDLNRQLSHQQTQIAMIGGGGMTNSFGNSFALQPHLGLENFKFGSHVQKVGDMNAVEINAEKEIFKNKLNKTMRNLTPKSCRICLGEENEPDNELISPCRCSGTMKYIHLNCLQEWLNGKKSVRDLQFSSIVLFRISQCELCQTTFPDFIKDYNKKIEIFQLNRPSEGHYLILEVIGMPTGKTFQIIKLSERHSLKVGRGHDADIRVADISVSRCHSLIRLDSESNQVILSDYHSKFGTLFLMRQPLKIESETEEIVFQQGKSTFALALGKMKKSLTQQLCKCIIPKKTQTLELLKDLPKDFEYFQCIDSFPKDLQKHKRLLFGENWKPSASFQSQRLPGKPGEDALDQIENNFMSEGGGLDSKLRSANPRKQSSVQTGKAESQQKKKRINLNQVAPYQNPQNQTQSLDFQSQPSGNMRPDLQTLRQQSPNVASLRESQAKQHVQVQLNLHSHEEEKHSHPHFSNHGGMAEGHNSPSRSGVQPSDSSHFRRLSDQHRSGTGNIHISPRIRNGIHEEIKEEEEEKLMDEICKEQEERTQANTKLADQPKQQQLLGAQQESQAVPSDIQRLGSSNLTPQPDLHFQMNRPQSQMVQAQQTHREAATVIAVQQDSIDF